MPEGKQVEQFFSQIAPAYETANHYLSFGIDWYWRKRLTRAVQSCNPKVVLDLATGTGSVAFALGKALGPQIDIVGVDFCEPMLAVARQKQQRSSAGKHIHFLQADCLKLGFPDNAFDAITIAFGFRNLEDQKLGMAEMYRVLRPGGTLFILEFSQPYIGLRPFYYFYLKYILPAFAKWITQNKQAYQYLGDSIEAFPGRGALKELLERGGFREVRFKTLTGGIVAIHEARK